METQRSNVALVMPAPDDPEYAAAAACTPKQEIFARTWAETGNKAAAYRAAFNPGPRTLPGTIWGSASTMSRLPQVLALYKVITHQAMLETIMTVRELFQLQVDIATADPTEIVKVVSRCCRHCYGQDHAYQWRDISEYTNECVVALDKQQMPPTDLGGYGFNGALEPVLTCPHCLGVGITHTEITPSDKLTGKARKLYAGAKEDRFGAIEVKLHDQQKAAELAGRILGAFNDKLDLRTPAEREKDEEQKRISKNVTAEDAARAYLSLVS
jgi:Terminase small subunit.